MNLLTRVIYLQKMFSNPVAPAPCFQETVVSLSCPRLEILPGQVHIPKKTFAYLSRPENDRKIGVRAGARTGYVIPGRDGNGGLEVWGNSSAAAVAVAVAVHPPKVGFLVK